MVIFILGLPGSGKGTQAALISKELGIGRIGFSDLLRREASRGTKDGGQLSLLMRAHKLAPTDVAMRLIRERLLAPDVSPGFVLEGFPRNCAQAVALQAVLKDQNRSVHGVFFLDITKAEAVRRLSVRAICPNEACGEITSRKHDSGLLACDRCGTVLIRRPDDVPEIAIERCDLAATSHDWEHLRAFYQTKFHKIPAMGKPRELMRDIISRARREQN